MMRKADFDNLLKNNIVEVKGINPFGYSLPETKAEPYENYYNKEEFQIFIDEMKSPKYREIYQSYNVGKGSELVEKNGRYGKMPPKMASVASSSRWCYLALRDGAYGLGSNGTVKFSILIVFE